MISGAICRSWPRTRPPTLALLTFVLAIGAGCGSHKGLSVGEDGSPADNGDAASASIDSANAADASLASGLDATTSPPDVSAGGCGPVSASSDLPGVRLEITSGQCALTQAQAAAGVTFGYRLVVDADVPGIVAHIGASDCGVADSSGLAVVAVISGNGQSFCPTCDLGRCAPNSTTTTANAGSFDYDLVWYGLNWQGPSDWGAPEGAAFPVGSYTLSVTATGTRLTDAGVQPFTVAVSRPLVILAGDGQ